MIEAIKRLIMACLFFYLGGLVVVSVIVMPYSSGPIETLSAAASWPLDVAQLILYKYGVINL